MGKFTRQKCRGRKKRAENGEFVIKFRQILSVGAVVLNELAPSFGTFAVLLGFVIL